MASGGYQAWQICLAHMFIGSVRAQDSPESKSLANLPFRGDQHTPVAHAISCMDARFSNQVHQACDMPPGTVTINAVAGACIGSPSTDENLWMSINEVAINAFGLGLLLHVSHQDCGAIRKALTGEIRHYRRTFLDSIRRTLKSDKIVAPAKVTQQMIKDVGVDFSFSESERIQRIIDQNSPPHPIRVVPAYMDAILVVDANGQPVLDDNGVQKEKARIQILDMRAVSEAFDYCQQEGVLEEYLFRDEIADELPKFIVEPTVHQMVARA